MIKRRSYEALWLLETGLRPRRFAKALTPSLLQIRLAASAPSAVAGRLSFSGSMLAHGRPGWAAKKSDSFSLRIQLPNGLWVRCTKENKFMLRVVSMQGENVLAFMLHA